MGLSYPPQVRLPVWMSPLEPMRIGALFDAPLAVDELYSEAIEAWDNTQAKNPMSTARWSSSPISFCRTTFSPKTDRASMMVSLESRAVFLDNDVVHFCSRLPHAYKYRRGVRKFLLRQAVEGLVSAAVLRRPKKGFGVPFARWLRQMPNAALRAIPGLRPDWITNAGLLRVRGKEDERLLLWSWLSLQGIVGKHSGMALAA